MGAPERTCYRLESPVPSAAEPEQDRPGCLRRHRRLLLALGAAAGAAVLVLVVLAAAILYKASRVFSRPLPDIVPADAVLYIESLDFDSRFLRLRDFVESVRSSERYRRLDASSADWREIQNRYRIDESLDNAFRGLDDIRRRTGIDPLEAVAGTETVLVLYAPPGGFPAPAEEGGEARGPETRSPPPSHLFITRLATWPVRIAALFPGLVMSRMPGNGVSIEKEGGFRKIIATGKAGDVSTEYFTILDDLLILSDRTDLLEATLALASSEVSTGLSSNPLFQRAIENTSPPETALARFWGDFDRFDAWARIRKNAEFKVRKYPYNVAGRYLNEIQRGVVDLQACEAMAGWIETDATGALVVEGTLFYRDAAYAELAPRKGSSSLDAFGADLAPGGSLSLVAFQRSFQDLWNGITSGEEGEGLASTGMLMKEHGDRIRRLLPALGPDAAVFFKPHPDAARGGEGLPMPWTGLAIRCRDPFGVGAELQEIFRLEVEKLARKLTDKPPFLQVETRNGYEISYVTNLIEQVKRETSPHFSPGFAVLRDRIVLFTEERFASEILGALIRLQPSLSRGEAFSRMREEGVADPDFMVFLDVEPIARALSMPRYRTGIAEMLLPEDWEAMNAEIERSRGVSQDAAGFGRLQDEKLRELHAKRARLAATLPGKARVLTVLESFGVSGTLLADASGRPGGVHGRITFLFHAGESGR